MHLIDKNMELYHAAHLVTKHMQCSPVISNLGDRLNKFEISEVRNNHSEHADTCFTCLILDFDNKQYVMLCYEHKIKTHELKRLINVQSIDGCLPITLHPQQPIHAVLDEN